MLANRYGQFSPDGRTYRISDPQTPMPWVNVICNGRYGLIVSQNGGGFSWLDDAQHGVLTRWDMDLVRDCSGKFLYLSDLESGSIWSAAPAPTFAPMESYACSHTQGVTAFTTQAQGVLCEWTLAVPPGEQGEVWLVTLTNTTSRARKLRVSSYFEWSLGVAPDVKREFHKLFITTGYDAQRQAIVASKNMWDIPPKSEKQHWNQPYPNIAAHALHAPALKKVHAIADKALFLGRYGQTHAPAAMRGELADGAQGFGRFGDACAALGGELELAPGQSVQMHWVLAIGPDHRACMGAIDRLLQPATARAVPAQAGEMWDKLSVTRVQSQLPAFDLLNNHWLPYQAISGRMWGRTGYYQQSGAFGFRDQLQDSHVWLPIDPARTLAHIRLCMTRQFVDGSVNHWWHALADFGNHTACSDDYLWLPYLTAGYIKETGDLGCLRSSTSAFRDDAALVTDLLDHCERSVERAFKRMSPRGLPLIGSCDWNDGLSALGVDEKGESVWLGWFIAGLLRDWADIYTMIGQPAKAETCISRRKKLVADINAHAWDPAGYFRCATKDSGEWIGASGAPEGKIHLNPQTWAIMADGVDDERRALCWQAVQRNLLTPFGPLLLSPAYTVPDATVGYITRYSPGSRENGGVYMHAATWALLTACKLKQPELVEKIWHSIAPPTRGADAEAYWAEPYVLPGNVDGPTSERPGRAGWTWYTGSAAWLNKVSLEWLLGLRPTLRGLLIDPCPAPSLGRVQVSRVYRGKTLRVSFDAATCREGLAPSVTLNGQILPGNLLTDSIFATLGPVTDVGVTWGAPVLAEPKHESAKSAAVGALRK